MSVAADALNLRIHLSDPKPAFCSCCYQGARGNVRFVDFDAAFDSGQIIEERDGSVVRRETGDDLHLCESCVKSAVEALGLKPELHSRQYREIKKLELERDHWRDYAKRAEALLKDRPEGKGR